MPPAQLQYAGHPGTLLAQAPIILPSIGAPPAQHYPINHYIAPPPMNLMSPHYNNLPSPHMPPMHPSMLPAHLAAHMHCPHMHHDQYVMSSLPLQTMPAMQPLPPPPMPPPLLNYGASSHFKTGPVSERLLRLNLETGYDLIQENGQRKFGPPPNWTGPPPPRGSEVFVGKLPVDCFEDELVPIFEQIGQLYELRLMMNFTGFNRGFAFVTYIDVMNAWKAVELLNNYEIRPGHRIGVSKSIDNCRLYIGGIPTDKTKDDIWEELANVVQGIADVILYPAKENRSKNRGFMFLEFETHRMAAMAKRKMTPGHLILWDQKVTVDWADPEPDVNPMVLANVTKLFVRNTSELFGEQLLRTILGSFLSPASVTRVYVCQDYGFIHFDNRKNAEFAKSRLHGFMIGGHRTDVQWARPRHYGKHFNAMTAQLAYCRSLPPRLRKMRRNSH